ncbi:thiamine diphosphokinase [Pelosinus sp. UFO1]|uniref:thiamine diphosphokinase n=1 Tax=Pelosinus sp. UFO1 TaxID=484770 RepID=UPI0004D0FFDA|nr:thiamine diphosphokinase [Pelosinus sp. UFO1]AIF49748.1 thiamine pyrophosphokinase [Pelosinus sp. UFO1]
MKNQLILPQLRCSFEKELPDSEVLLVAGGRQPASKWLAQAATQFPVWCIDSGVDICRMNNIIPERLIGDGDSATSQGWSWGKELGIPVEVYPPEKNLTDLQLALQTVGSLHGEAIVVVTGVWGGRFDHAFSNIYSLKGCEAFGIRGCCADEKEVLILLKGKDSVVIDTATCPKVVSLLPLSSECSGVCIDGVHWPLVDVQLHDTLPYAVSNRPSQLGTSITVTIEAGWLGIYLCWDEKGLNTK